jgi:predicted RNA methylase
VKAHNGAHWDEYNGIQGSRAVRPLLQTALEHACTGRTAIDLGCGAGVETRALLNAGWRVHAIDGAPGTEAVLRRTVGGIHQRLTVDVRRGPKHWHVFDVLATTPASPRSCRRP